MQVPRSMAALCFAIVLATSAYPIAAQNFPNKPIRFVTSEIGGGADFVARIVAQGLSDAMGQQVLIDNRGGVASIAAQIVAKSPADGYTLLFYGSSMWILPFLQNTPYDPIRDFAPITWVVSLPNVVVVHPSLPVKSIKELIALAQARPGELNYGSGTTGTPTHLAAELFKSMTNTNIARVAYKGAGPALTAVLGGEVQLQFATPSVSAPHIKSGRLRALAVTSIKPSALVPGLPTVAATVPGYESISINAMFAPAGTSAAIVNRLNQEVVRFLRRPEVNERLLNAGVEVVGNTPQEFAVAMKADMAALSKVIRDAGIRAD
jgi:tripartite-type tricarboxylate transporter receptor subunit TctC